MESRPNALMGMLLMVLAAILGAGDSIIARSLAGEVHPFFMGFTRASFGLLMFLPWILLRHDMLKSHYRFRHVVRAALKLASLVAFFFAYALSPLADATAIAFSSPLFVTIGAVIFLSEKLNLLRVVGVLIGFAGILMIVRPMQAEGLTIGLLFALLGAVLVATIQLILKPMSGKDSTETLVAWNLIITVPLALIPAVFFWAHPSPQAWALLALQGFIGGCNMYLITRAFSLAEASLITPLEFVRLPIVAVLAFLVFGETVSLMTLLGGLVIFLSTLLVARSATVRTVRIGGM